MGTESQEGLGAHVPLLWDELREVEEQPLVEQGWRPLQDLDEAKTFCLLDQLHQAVNALLAFKGWTLKNDLGSPLTPTASCV